jgi:hypothetical protein
MLFRYNVRAGQVGQLQPPVVALLNRIEPVERNVLDGLRLRHRSSSSRASKVVRTPLSGGGART